MTGGPASERLDVLLEVEAETGPDGAGNPPFCSSGAFLKRALRRRGLSATSTGLARCIHGRHQVHVGSVPDGRLHLVRDELDAVRMAGRGALISTYTRKMLVCHVPKSLDRLSASRLPTAGVER